MESITLDRRLATAYVKAIPPDAKAFYKRDIPVTPLQYGVVMKLEAKIAVLRKWQEEAYVAMSSKRGVCPPFPKELEDYAEETKTINRQKARAKKRVRAGSSGDVE